MTTTNRQKFNKAILVRLLVCFYVLNQPSDAHTLRSFLT